MARPDDAFIAHALDLFSGLDLPVSARRMFGGLGFYAGGLFFAIGDHAEGRLWLKVDDGNRAAFEAEGGQPFTYTMPGHEVMTMAYLTPPDGALEDAEAMLPWATLGVEAARRAAAAKAAKAARPKTATAKAKTARPARSRAVSPGTGKGGAARKAAPRAKARRG